MHITLETDYAVRIIDCLARNGGRVGAKKIAETTRVTLRFSLKILRKLVGKGLVRSFKGAQGGYELAKEPAEITLNDVLEAIEGPYLFSRCLNAEHNCNRVAKGDYCPYNEIFGDISDKVQQRLKEVNFESTIHKAGPAN